MNDLRSTRQFDKRYKELIGKNKKLGKRIIKALALLRQNPFYQSLKTHRVATRNFGQRLSSWVTGDIRVIWDFDDEQTSVIVLLDIGRHSGAEKVYR